MPQWDFLNFLREAGQRFASLKVMMNTEAVDLIRRGETVAGVRAMTPDGPIDIEADLTIACDGRHSTVRERAGLRVEEIGAPMDVLWFRVGRKADETENLFARMEPILRSGIADVKSFDDVKLLTVAINRLARWTRPGLLLIGDAAHAMSPVGGVGVNLAVQDAVATANLLADKLRQGCPTENELDAVRRRREFPVRMTQRMQVIVQNNIISGALQGGDRPLKVPLVVRLITALPWLQGIPARLIALGVRPEHVQSKAAPAS